MTPTVSVIIPNFNHGQHLKQRIDTVLSQTCTDFEVIILDDCSTDNSQEIINRYAGDSRVSHIEFNTKNMGNPFLQWAKGVAIAKGEWLWIAESDDYADSRFLEKCIEAANRFPGAGMIYCDSYVVVNNGSATGTFAPLKNAKFRTNRWSKDHSNKGVDEIADYLLSEGTINNTSAVLFRRDTFIAANPFDISFRYIGDKYAFIKVLSVTDVAYVSEALNYYRDPFNTKHADRSIEYYDEHFLIFDWVYKNLTLPKKKFYQAFYRNTRNSLFRGWNTGKLRIYRKLFLLNRRLFIKSIFNNLWQPFMERIGHR